MRRHLEDDLQKTCLQWFKLQYPRKIIFHVPNGGTRNIREAARLKKQGVLAGVFDLFLAEPKNSYHGFWIEMKFGKNKLTDAQQSFQDAMRTRSYRTAECRSVEEFQSLIVGYLGATK